MKKFKVTTKLSITYIVLIIILIVIGAIVLYKYSKYKIYANGIGGVAQAVELMMVQIDERLANMEQTTVEVLGNNDFISMWEGAAARNQDEETLKEIKRVLTKSYMNKMDIRRVALLREDGSYVCTGNHHVTREEVKERYQYIENLGESNFSSGRIFLSPHEDFWDREGVGIVISEIKPIKNAGKELVGYLEVQQNVFYIKNVCKLFFNGERLDIMVFFGDQDHLFFSQAKEQEEAYIKEIRDITKRYTKVRETRTQLIFTANSNYFSGRTVCILEKQILFQPLTTVAKGIALAGILLIVLTVIYTMVATKFIMRSFHLLVNHMAETDLLNFEKQPKIKVKDIETEILLTSFQEMTGRFQEAILQQRKLEEVQTKTLFGILQSEIRPHFLYNTLGSIANMCEMEETEEAADACYSLTEILRYASSYANSEVRVAEEIENLKAYLSIMKSRYRQRLSYEIVTDEAAKYFMLPKLTYQPLVENAIKYSLLESEQVVINIYTIVLANQLIIEIKDNGCGMDKEVGERVARNIRDYKAGIGDTDMIERIKIGGMGLSGTLIRLSIFFGEDFSYQLSDNNDEGGTTIVLNINMDKNR